jgi:hypothetical protein
VCVAALVVPIAAARAGDAPRARASAACADYANQAAAQRAADTVDADGDGIYCESLPCPCLKPGAGGATPMPTATPEPGGSTRCSKPTGVQTISFSKTKYAHIRAHTLRAIRRGWPTTLVVNRPSADARRDRMLESWPTRAGYDCDEYPPAVGRGRGPGLTKGTDPTGWKADVAYVPSGENRSHGSALGTKLRRFATASSSIRTSARAWWRTTPFAGVLTKCHAHAPTIPATAAQPAGDRWPSNDPPRRRSPAIS